jgi:ribosomal protein L22
MKEWVLSKRNERVVRPPRDARQVSRKVKGSAKREARPTVQQGELFEAVILSKPRQREKTTRVGEAMREGGLDEGALARAYIKLLQKLLESAEGNANDKFDAGRAEGSGAKPGTGGVGKFGAEFRKRRDERSAVCA